MSTFTAVDVVPWWHLAACKGMDPDTFFPARTWGGVEGRQIYDAAAAPALAVCARCDVVEQCRAEVRRHERTTGLQARDGVWGGTTPHQRWEADRPVRTGGKAWRRGQRDGGQP